MLPNYFDYIFVHLRQKARLRPELSLKFLSTLGPNPAGIRIWPDLQLCGGCFWSIYVIRVTTAIAYFGRECLASSKRLRKKAPW